jgi:hypothetical protein
MDFLTKKVVITALQFYDSQTNKVQVPETSIFPLEEFVRFILEGVSSALDIAAILWNKMVTQSPVKIRISNSVLSSDL